ncbi:hypothetical protein LCGC14_0974920 [marine sediment metagenome]|uniref:Uncharacterized protein n=1 Tax=marine sediment metagenome TaxID=412755 RepID=A0A0F9QTT8_9ZZZZ
MKLGRDFWIILKILAFIIDAFKRWAEEENEDTPKGQP